mmetsp:Transcript_30181/g.37027  ORF Transcript_30181/g.37027 Transcript_30181/m.37027 type:complete len:90 (-) Transcript_30181:58-327(-)
MEGGASISSSCRSHEDEGSSRVGARFSWPELLGAAVFSSNRSARVTWRRASKTGMRAITAITDQIFVCKAEKPEGQVLRGCSTWLAEFM